MQWLPTKPDPPVTRTTLITASDPLDVGLREHDPE